MVFIVKESTGKQIGRHTDKDPGGRWDAGDPIYASTYGYQIIINDDGVQRIVMRAEGFSSPGEVLDLQNRMKMAVVSGNVIYGREAEGFGFSLLENKNDPRTLIGQEFGWTDPSQVKEHVNDLRTALTEGVKMMI